ncbi:hypothetical protein GA0115243_106221 [Streptomyces sp. ScaeMP-e83]|nr:hypothetical protein GA0115243_106221 [Streptomyces sp. ScaeMP-e83]
MLTGVTAPGPQHSAAALRRLLDLLAQGAAAEESDRPAATAREAGALADILDGGILIHDADGAELARARTGPQPPPTPAVAASRARGRAVPLNGTWSARSSPDPNSSAPSR